jgi:branched-chain amino acid transport system substrate-binding protein
VVAVIGHLQSYVTVPAAAIYEMAGVVLLAPTATDVELTKRGYTHVFRASFVDPEIGAQMADYVRKRGYKRVAILYVRTDYGRALANAFDERIADHGMTVAARQSYDPNEVVPDGFGTLMEAWGRLELDAIFLAGEVPLAGQLIAGIRAAGLKIPILGGDAMSSPALIEGGGKATEGTVVAAIFHPDVPTPEVSRFVQQFRQRYGMDPDPSSALGYDAVHVLADAMTRARSLSGDDVATALHATHYLRGVTGPFIFGPSGDLIGRKIVKLIVKNGQFHYLPDEAL